jgi:1-acyl-sn-glycerol-3-phosphate acyltransferase
MAKSGTNETSKTSREQFFELYSADEDEYGFSLQTYATVERFIRFFYKKWFGVKTVGLNNIPAKGKALLFGNHSGVLPIDGCLLYDAVINQHPEPRRIRFLVTKFLLTAPMIGKTLRGFGCIPPDYETATKLLRKNELVFFYPEAEKGTGKLYKNRYKLVEFNPGFVKAAIETGAPLVPIVTIGGDEIYPLLFNLKPIAKLMDAPYWPVTPFYPMLPFPFNAIPLPVKILICVGEPFELKYAPEEAENENLVAEVSNDIQNFIQAKINDLLEIRTSPFARWNLDKVNDYAATANRKLSLEKHLK